MSQNQQGQQALKVGRDPRMLPEYEALRADPSLANSDPLATGWFFKVKLSEPAQVDALLDKVVSATTRPELVVSLRALDRVLRHGHYVVPHWYGAVHRVSWRASVFDRPANLPRFYQPEALVTTVWWSPSAGGASAAATATPAVGQTAVKKGP